MDIYQRICSADKARLIAQACTKSRGFFQTQCFDLYREKILDVVNAVALYSNGTKGHDCSAAKSCCQSSVVNMETVHLPGVTRPSELASDMQTRCFGEEANAKNKSSSCLGKTEEKSNIMHNTIPQRTVDVFPAVSRRPSQTLTRSCDSWTQGQYESTVKKALIGQGRKHTEYQL